MGSKVPVDQSYMIAQLASILFKNIITCRYEGLNDNISKY